MAEIDIDCMVDHALSDPSPDARGELSWTTEELDAFAADSDVDFSMLYDMTD